MKKKFWLTLYNIGVSILFLLSLYSYAKGMAGFSLFWQFLEKLRQGLLLNANTCRRVQR